MLFDISFKGRNAPEKNWKNLKLKPQDRLMLKLKDENTFYTFLTSTYALS